MLDLDCLEIQVTCIVATPSLSLSITSGLMFNCSRLITSSSLPILPTISSSSSLSLTWCLSLIIDLQCSALNLKIRVNIYIYIYVCVCVCFLFWLLGLVLHAMYNKLNFCFCGLFWCYLHFSKWVFFFFFWY